MRMPAARIDFHCSHIRLKSVPDKVALRYPVSVRNPSSVDLEIQIECITHDSNKSRSRASQLCLLISSIRSAIAAHSSKLLNAFRSHSAHCFFSSAMRFSADSSAATNSSTVPAACSA
ncbi:hypothetical protein [Salmonella phage ST160]|uniref:hypothetical protein n=1 Tax=Salmonella phage ST160 TaxID=714583 RepID=UPI0001F38B5B|nr:hypothetical protein SaPhST160_gp09 [Salmonella phage ST160]ADC81107.1 hypothetical protein [Salmonella phage ST160]